MIILGTQNILTTSKLKIHAWVHGKHTCYGAYGINYPCMNILTIIKDFQFIQPMTLILSM